MSIAVIFNSLSGHRSARRNLKMVDRLQQELGHSVESFYCNHQGELTEAIDIILRSDLDTLIVSGGDGTLNRVINTLLNNAQLRPINLAIMPMGTGNSFALDLHIKTVDDAFAALNKQRLQTVDVGKAIAPKEHRYFINNLGFGLVHDIARDAAKMRAIGKTSYTLATLAHLLKLPSYQFDLGELGTPASLFLEICNSRFTGSDMMMAPDALLNDGLFQVLWIDEVSAFKLVPALLELYKGTHLDYPFVQTLKTASLSVVTDKPCYSIIDGDLWLSAPVEVRMSEHKLSFYTLAEPS
jgi:YegS/Rv2252/BmrU family lipid kinase